MENFRNYYDILGISSDATAEEIKKTFRQLARKYHPDLNPGNQEAEETFKLIGEAYEVLSDVERRSQYDDFSRYWQQDGFNREVEPAEGWGVRWGRMADMDFSQFPDFNIFIDELLGQKPPMRSDTDAVGQAPSSYRADYTEPRREDPPWNSRPSREDGYRPRDIEANLEMPLERAYSGGLERVRLEDGRAIEVDMPGGLVSGQQIRLKGQGINGGNLYLKITVPEHPFYQLDGTDLYCLLPVSPAEAVLGAQVEVPTLDGPVQMNLPQGVRSGQRLRLAQKGYPNELGVRGDQVVEIAIAIPTYLTGEEQALYEKLLQLESSNPRRGLPL